MQKQKHPRSKTIIIPKLHTYLIKEFDIICDEFKIKLLQGSAQVYGLSIKRNYPHKYVLPCSIPVFTWQGCQIMVQWKQEQGMKNSDDQWVDITENNYNVLSPMIRYLQIHHELTTLRKLAIENNNQGPRLAIIGGQNTAIENTSALMLNYAGKMSMKPIYVDLDIQKNMIFIDGSIGSIVYDYGKMEKLFDRSDKLTYFYGNRKMRRQSFLNQAKNLANAINKKLHKDLKNYKEKGSTDPYPSFCSGVIMRCPKIKDKVDKKIQKELIGDLVHIFGITHLIITQSSQFSAYLSKILPQKVQKYNTMKLEGTESYLQLPRPIKTKIQRYFDPQLQFDKPLTLKIEQITLYQLIEKQNEPPYCRKIDIQTESIVKSTIAILHAKNPNQQSFDKYEVAQRIQSSAISCLAFIFKVGKGQIILHVTSQSFWQECKNKIWVSTMSQSDQ